MSMRNETDKNKHKKNIPIVDTSSAIKPELRPRSGLISRCKPNLAPSRLTPAFDSRSLITPTLDHPRWCSIVLPSPAAECSAHRAVTLLIELPSSFPLSVLFSFDRRAIACYEGNLKDDTGDEESMVGLAKAHLKR